jgi:vacuolar-type H+-ATPase subunit E/Vma4
MSLTCYNLSEDWGWYIDIESSKPLYQTRKDLIKIPNKYYNKLETIEEEEDQYEFYINIQKNLDDISSKNIDINIEQKNLEYVKQIFNVGSTTMLTAMLTYIIFYML